MNSLVPPETSVCCWELREKGRYGLCLPWIRIQHKHSSNDLHSQPNFMCTFNTHYLSCPFTEAAARTAQRKIVWILLLSTHRSKLPRTLSSSAVNHQVLNFCELQKPNATDIQRPDHAAKHEGRHRTGLCKMSTVSG